jgi:hypothetical protein
MEDKATNKNDSVSPTYNRLSKEEQNFVNEEAIRILKLPTIKLYLLSDRSKESAAKIESHLKEDITLQLKHEQETEKREAEGTGFFQREARRGFLAVKENGKEYRTFMENLTSTPEGEKSGFFRKQKETGFSKG